MMKPPGSLVCSTVYTSVERARNKQPCVSKHAPRIFTNQLLRSDTTLRSANIDLTK